MINSAEVQPSGMLRWSVHLEGGPRRVNHAAVAVGHKVYTFGGYCSGEDYETLRQIDVHVFNTGKLEWITQGFHGLHFDIFFQVVKLYSKCLLLLLYGLLKPLRKKPREVSKVILENVLDENLHPFFFIVPLIKVLSVNAGGISQQFSPK